MTLAAGTYEISSSLRLPRGYLQITSTNLSRPDLTVIKGNRTFRLIQVWSGVTPYPFLGLKGVTLKDGRGSTDGGGALYANGASVHLFNSEIVDNQSTGNGHGVHFENGFLEIRYCGFARNREDSPTFTSIGAGGGLYVGGLASAYVLSSSFTENQSLNGGAIAVGPGITFPSAWGRVDFYMQNCTLSRNAAGAMGGGLHINNGPPVDLLFNTIVKNGAGANYDAGYTRAGGGISFYRVTGTPLRVVGNIIALNRTIYPQDVGHPGPGADCLKEYFGSDGEVTETLYNDNIIGKLGGCSHLGNEDMWGIGTDATPFDPELDILANNGSRIYHSLWTHKPEIGSPAIGGYSKENGNGNTTTTGCRSTDGRGYYRPGRPGVCDVGAVEYAGSTSP